MTKFGIFWAGVKGAFSFKKTIKESVIDYILDCINKCVSENGKLVKTISQIHDITGTFLKYATKYVGWCPVQWKSCYDRVIAAVATLNCAVEDMKLTRDELDACGAAFKAVYIEWNED